MSIYLACFVLQFIREHRNLKDVEDYTRFKNPFIFHVALYLLRKIPPFRMRLLRDDYKDVKLLQSEVTTVYYITNPSPLF